MAGDNIAPWLGLQAGFGDRRDNLVFGKFLASKVDDHLSVQNVECQTVLVPHQQAHGAIERGDFLSTVHAADFEDPFVFRMRHIDSTKRPSPVGILGSDGMGISSETLDRI